MRPLTVLKKDHATLREKLTLLEQLLPLTRANERPIRELQGAISRSLHCHCEQESYLLTTLEGPAQRHPSKFAEQLSGAHTEQQRTLRVLDAVLTSPTEEGVEDRTAQASHLIHRLRALMSIEEDQLFGLLEGLRDPSHRREHMDHLTAIAAQAHREGDPSIPPSRDL